MSDIRNWNASDMDGFEGIDVCRNVVGSQAMDGELGHDDHTVISTTKWRPVNFVTDDSG